MIRSTHHRALAASKRKQIVLANQFFDDGRDLSDIASELNSRGFQQANGKRLSYKNVADLIDDKNFEV